MTEREALRQATDIMISAIVHEWAESYPHDDFSRVRASIETGCAPIFSSLGQELVHEVFEAVEARATIARCASGEATR